MIRRAFSLSAALMLLAGCGPLVQVGGNTPAPSSLLTVEATSPPTGSVSGSPILTVLPDVPGKLRTLRVPVITAANEVQYLGRGHLGGAAERPFPPPACRHHPRPAWPADARRRECGRDARRSSRARSPNSASTCAEGPPCMFATTPFLPLPMPG